MGRTGREGKGGRVGLRAHSLGTGLLAAVQTVELESCPAVRSSGTQGMQGLAEVCGRFEEAERAASGQQADGDQCWLPPAPPCPLVPQAHFNMGNLYRQCAEFGRAIQRWGACLVSKRSWVPAL